MMKKIINADRCAASKINYNEIKQAHCRIVEQRTCLFRQKMSAAADSISKHREIKRETKINWNKNADESFSTFSKAQKTFPTLCRLQT